MARRSTPSRRSAPSHQQTRQAHTTSHQPVPQPHAAPPAPVAQPRQPGLFGQMAATAAGVAVGSSVGHAIGSLFTGGRRDDDQQIQHQQTLPSNETTQPTTGVNCDKDANAFAKCLEDNTSDISACQMYLEQLKSCRQMAQQY